MAMLIFVGRDKGESNVHVRWAEGLRWEITGFNTISKNGRVYLALPEAARQALRTVNRMEKSLNKTNHHCEKDQ